MSLYDTEDYEMSQNRCAPRIQHHLSLTGKAILTALIAILLPLLSCDGMELFNYAEDMAGYGPTWSFDDPSLTVTVTFPENVTNALYADNYRILNYTGDGAIAVSPSYGDSDNIVKLSLSISGTTISNFNVQLEASSDTSGNSTSITAESGYVFKDDASPSYYPGCFFGCITP